VQHCNLAVHTLLPPLSHAPVAVSDAHEEVFHSPAPVQETLPHCGSVGDLGAADGSSSRILRLTTAAPRISSGMDNPHLPLGRLLSLDPHHAYPPPPHPHPSPDIAVRLSMPSFQQQPSPPATAAPPVTAPASSTEASDRARVYKSRNKRPCDFCRYKKAACHLETAPPCELCIRYNKECTFVESPAKRRRPNEQNGDKSTDAAFRHSHSSRGSIDHGHGFRNGSMGSTDMQYGGMPWDNAMSPPFQMPGLTMANSALAPEFAFDPQLYQEPMSFEPFEPMSASTTTMNSNRIDNRFGNQRGSLDTNSPESQSALLPSDLRLPFDSTSGEPSLDQQDSSNAQMIGISGESDPYLLAKYRFDEYNEAAFQSVRIRKMSSGPLEHSTSVPTFFTIQHNALASKAQPQNREDSDDRFRRELEYIVNDEIGKRLINLFYKYVQPYFPILRRKDVTGSREPKDVPPCVLAAIYGHALPFCTWDEKLCVEVYTPPSADALFKIAWQACQALLHTPNIAVMQTLLLLVQRRPTNKHVSDTPFKWVMMTTAVSVAQALGLNRDPTGWPIPSWEIKQRKRLAWATFIQDKWLALNFGRSSHIQADDWDVPPLTDDDFIETEEATEKPSAVPAHHFAKLCELTLVVDDILRDLFSIKATRQLHKSLEATLEVAKPLRIRLTEWFQALPPGLLPNQSISSSNDSSGNGRPRSSSHELDGSGSLQLAYITAKIELFRAMLRPQVTDANAAAVTALRTGALAVAKEIVDFLDSLNARELEAFWASYARTNFTIASSFMLLLFITSPTAPDAKECLALLNSWRSLLKLKSRSCDLLNLALLRLDSVFVAGMERLIELSPAALQAWTDSGM